MNHIYRTIWNEAIGTWLAVSETTVSNGKSSSSRTCDGRPSKTLVFLPEWVLGMWSRGRTAAHFMRPPGLRRLGLALVLSALSAESAYAFTVSCSGSSDSGLSENVGICGTAANYNTSLFSSNIAIGEGSVAGDGTTTSTSGQTGGAIAIGDQTMAKAIHATAVGYQASAAANWAVAMGPATKVTGTSAVGIGDYASAAAARAVALGGYATAVGASSVALGSSAKASKDSDIAIGNRASTNAGSNGNNIAMGNSITTGANGQNVAIGSGATTANAASTAGGAVAIGRGQTATGDGAVALGDPNTANGTGAVTLGANNIAAGDAAGGSAANGAVAIGNGNQAIGQGAVALGNTASATVAGALAFGDAAQSTAQNAIALGSNAVASHAGSIALGANAIADGSTLGSAAYNPGTGTLAGVSPVGEVSVGGSGAERRITHVAAGAQGTDAVNVSQLKGVQSNVDAVNDRAVKYDGNPGDPKTQITLNGPVSTDGGKTGGTKLTNVAAGDLSPTSTDAVNGAQLYQTNQTVNNLGGSTAAVLGGGASYNPATGTLTGPTFHIAGTQQTTLSDAINALNSGWNVTTSGNASGTSVAAVRPGDTMTIDGGKNIVLTQDGAKVSIATADKPTFTSVGIDGGGPVLSAAGLNMAGQKITNVAPGDVSATSTDVVNGSQLNDTNEKVQKTSDQAVKYDTHPDGSIDYGSVTLNPGGAPSKLTNVAAGDLSPTSTDAVNGAQLYDANQKIQQVSDRAVQYDTNPDGSINYGGVTLAGPKTTDGGLTGGTKLSNLAQGELSQDSSDAVNGAQLYQTNQNVANIGQQVSDIVNGGGIKYFHANGGASTPLQDSQANGAGSTAMGPAAQSNGQNSVAIGNGATAQKDGDVALGAGSVANRGAESYIGKYSDAQNNTAGSISVGVPGSERTMSNVADGKEATDAVNLRQLDGAVKTANDYTDQQVQAVAGTAAQLSGDLTNVTRRMVNMNGDITALRNGSAGMFQVSAELMPVAPSASGSNSMAGGSGAVASGAGSAALGNQAAATGGNATAVGNGATAAGNNAVALGAGSIATRDNTVSVGSPDQARQIVNVAPGTEGTDAVNVNQLNQSLGQMANQLQRGIHDTARKAYSGVAAATALTMIPDVDKDKVLAVGVGMGSYQGYQAMALGATVRVRENVKMRAGVSTSGSGTAFGMGASMQW